MNTEPARFVEQVMGLPLSLALRGRHARTAEGREACAAVVASMRAADEVFSTYRPDSVVCRIDRGEMTVADAPPEVAEVLAIGAEAKHHSGGAFDVWRTGPDGRDHLDPSGVVKGWAVERAGDAVRGLEDTDFCLSAGGDLTCRTLDPDTDPWLIGIEHPLSPRQLIATVPLSTGALATSGRAHRGNHVVDARTGRPATGTASVTVIGDSLTWVDIEATAAFARGADAARWLSALGRPGLVVADDGTPTIVDGRSAIPEAASQASHSKHPARRQPMGRHWSHELLPHAR